MDAVEIDGDGRGMSAAAIRETTRVIIDPDGWCLYSALLEVFSPPVPPVSNRDVRRLYSRMFAFILGKIMKHDLLNNLILDDELTIIKAVLESDISYGTAPVVPGRPVKGYMIEELFTPNDPSGCIFKDMEDIRNGRCRKYYTSLYEFFDHLGDLSPGSTGSASIWGDYIGLNHAIKNAFTHILGDEDYTLLLTTEPHTGKDIQLSNGRPNTNTTITLLHDGRHFDVEISGNRYPIDPINILYGSFENGGLLSEDDKEQFNAFFREDIARIFSNTDTIRSIFSTRSAAAAGPNIPDYITNNISEGIRNLISQTLISTPITVQGAEPNYTGSAPWRGGGDEELLVKAAETLKTGAQLLLDLHTSKPVTAMPPMQRAIGTVTPAFRPQVSVAPKPRLPLPAVVVRAPSRRRLPLTQPRPSSLPSIIAAAAGEISGEEVPTWAPAPIDATLRERCEGAPIVTDECVQFELDKDIRAVHNFIERHQLKNTDPRMQDYTKDLTSGEFSEKALAEKYPDHNIYVRNEGGHPVKMKVSNPYRARAYRYPTEGGISFADPTGADLSGSNKVLHKQNVNLLKAIAPAAVIADKRFATAILESLWRCSSSQDLAGKPACFPARVLGELRLFEKYKDQASRKQLADDVRAFSEWGMVSDIMRQIIHGEIPPVRADAARVHAAAAELSIQAGISGEVAVAPIVSIQAGISGEVAASAQSSILREVVAPVAAPKPSAPSHPLRAIRRGLAVRAPTQIGALGPRFQHGVIPPTTIGTGGMVI